MYISVCVCMYVHIHTHTDVDVDERSIQVRQLQDSLNQSQFFAKHSNQSVRFILYRQKITPKCYFRVCQSGKI